MESLILTAGGIDACAYFTSPDVITEALMSGVTTMFGGGTGMNGQCNNGNTWSKSY